nr:CorA family divalent cation transporter [uncultured Mediterraneibacter sp.]
MIFRFGEQLIPVDMETWELNPGPALFVTDSQHAEQVLAKAGIVYENEIQMKKIGFCKLENQQDCVVGTLCIPKLLDVLGNRYKMYFFVNRVNVVIVDDDEFSLRLIRRIQRKKTRQGQTKERFLYNFIAEFMSRDQEMLVAYERRLLKMEEDVTQDHMENFQNQLMPIRRELLNLRSYYDEIMDLTKELEENENGFFLKKQLKYFGTLTDRADRLMSRTAHLLEYAQQVKEAYQSQIDARQNNNMQFLTVISTIFFPLTLITGWFGMNFRNMPGLDNGYAAVVALSVVIVIVCIVIFKKKKII